VSRYAAGPGWRQRAFAYRVASSAARHSAPQVTPVVQNTVVVGIFRPDFVDAHSAWSIVLRKFPDRRPSADRPSGACRRWHCDTLRPQTLLRQCTCRHTRQHRHNRSRGGPRWNIRGLPPRVGIRRSRTRQWREKSSDPSRQRTRSKSPWPVGHCPGLGDRLPAQASGFGVIAELLPGLGHPIEGNCGPVGIDVLCGLPEELVQALGTPGVPSRGGVSSAENQRMQISVQNRRTQCTALPGIGSRRLPRR
jgi:hypothetical protein